MAFYIPHLITLFLCLAVLGICLANTHLVIAKTDKDLLRIVLLMACFFQASTIITFIANQTLWVIKSHDELVGIGSQIGWLAYDYQNKLYHLSVAFGLNYWLHHKKQAHS